MQFEVSAKVYIDVVIGGRGLMDLNVYNRETDGFATKGLRLGRKVTLRMDEEFEVEAEDEEEARRKALDLLSPKKNYWAELCHETEDVGADIEVVDVRVKGLRVKEV